MDANSKALGLVREIEAAALNPEQWPKVLRRLVDDNHATWSGLISESGANRRPRIVSLVGLDSASQREYEDHYSKSSVLGPHIGTLPVGEVFADHMYADYARYLNCEARNEFFVPHDAHHILAVNLWQNHKSSGYFCIRRSDRIGAFSDDEISTLSLLSPILTNAVRINRLLKLERRKVGVLSQVLDTLGVGTICADAKGDIVVANRIAEKYLDASVFSGLEGLSPASVRSIVKSAVRRLAVEPGGGHDPVRLYDENRKAGGELELLLCPVSQQTSEGFDLGRQTVAAIVVIVDRASACRISPDLIQSLYGLTPSEARITAELVAQGSLREAAIALGITELTARSTLKRVYAKTRTAGQADLMRVILGGLARFLNV